jgi:proton-translocating NADH-quinone oxidoreductase chain N
LAGDMTTTLWLIGLPLITSPLVYLAGRTQVRRPTIARWLALLGLATAWVFFTQAVHEFSLNGAIETRLGTIALRVDGISLLLAAVALTLGTAVVIYSGVYMADEDGQEKYYALLIAMIGTMIGLACAADLFNLWIWFETMAVSSYLLVAFYRQQPASLEAGVKYLVQSATGSVLVLVGIALVLLQTGTLNLNEILHAEPSPNLMAAGALFLIGFGIKAAFVPLHTWLPDAHAQAPSGISAMLSGVVIEAGLIALLRVLLALTGVTPSWGALLMGFGTVNMVAGNLLALRQKQVKRLLAFSSLSHVGYMLLGLGIAIFSGQAGGAQGGFFHLLTHGLMKGLAFLSAGALLYGLHLAHGCHTPLTLTDLRGASGRYPLAAFTFSLALLGLGGLPPLAGFMSKWQIFVAGFETDNVLITALVVFAAMNSVFSLTYYVPLVNAMFRQQPSNGLEHGQPLPFSMQLPLIVLTMAVVAIGLWPSLMNGLIEPAGAAVATLLSH